jgi:hypothetical protein
MISPARNLGLEVGTKIGGEMIRKQTQAGRQPWLTLTDVARIFGEERAIAKGEDPTTALPVARATVTSYMKRYKVGTPRYGINPMPTATYPDPTLSPPGQQPLWVPEAGETVEDVERRLRAWWNSRVGPGVGGGRKPRVPAQQVPCACESGAMVAPGTRCDECVKNDPTGIHTHIDCRS